MQEKPHVISLSTMRRSSGIRSNFIFTENDIPIDGMTNARLDAWRIYSDLEIPTPSLEAWRRTDLGSLPADSFHLPTSEDAGSLPAVPDSLFTPLAAGAHGGQVILTSAGSSSFLDPSLSRQGVIFCDMKTALRDHLPVMERLSGKLVDAAEGKFSALVSALAKDGVLLYVPKNVIVELPLLSILWGPGSELAYISHIHVWVDDGASVTYVHQSASPDDMAASLHAGNVEILVGDGANLKFVELQSWGRNVWNFSHERASIGRDATMDWIFGAVGSRLTKNFSELSLSGEGATGRMSGFYFADGDQHLDHDTQQNHLAAHTTSDLLFKGALKGKSRSVWQGMIYVAPGAQKADGYQANRNLVLSPHARADSIPGLEILADDVRCTHGATVGRLEQEPLFYLKSRGIPDRDAEQLMVEGFFDPIMQRIPFEGVRAHFQQSIQHKMNADP